MISCHLFRSAVCAVVAVATATSVFATDYESANFISRDPVFGDYGAHKSVSGSYQQYDVGGQTVIGESTSSGFILRSGFLYFNEFTPRTESWRWYDDEANETPVSPLAAEDTSPTNVANGNVVKLRWTIRELAGISSASFKVKLQYSTYADFSQDVFDVVASASCLSNSGFCYADGAGDDNAKITTSTLSTSDSCVASVGTGCGTHNESGANASPYGQRFSAAMEYEFTLVPAGPLPETVYYFRAVTAQGGTPIVPFTGRTYPSLSTEPPYLTFAIIGVSSGTLTEGVTTDVTTTATSVPFGNLTVNVPVEAAQTLQVNTNATNGYAVFVYRESPMLNGAGGQIEDVAGTNVSPVAWAVPSGQDSAVGYHAGDDALTGGSSRFAPNDTYAAFDGTPREVAFSAGPVNNEEIDTIYKIEVGPLQPPGLYSGDIAYIIVPVF